MLVTIEVPDDLRERIKPYEAFLPEIIQIGLITCEPREGSAYRSVDDALQILPTLQTSAEILALRPSTSLQKRMDELLEKKRNTGLSEGELIENDYYLDIEHTVQMVKVIMTRMLSDLRTA